MIEIEQECYVVSECYDRDIKEIAYFEKEEDAAALKDTSVYYSYAFRKIKIQIYQSLEEFGVSEIEKAKEKAKAKLTPAELRLLGLV